MAGKVLGIAIALLLLAACGAREAGGPPPQPAPLTATPYQAVAITQTAPPAPPVTLGPATLTAIARASELQMTEQAISRILTTTPLGAEGYTAVALYETARAAATGAAVPPEQRGPTPDPSQLAGMPTPTAPPADADTAGMLQTSEAATATRAADYTATAARSEGALRFLLPPDLEARYRAANPQSSAEAYYVALTPRGAAPGPENTITLNGGLQAEATWRENQPGGLGAVIEAISVRGVAGTIASGGYGLTISWLEDGQAYAVYYGVAGDEAEALAFIEGLVAVERGAWDAAMRAAQQ